MTGVNSTTQPRASDDDRARDEFGNPAESDALTQFAIFLNTPLDPATLARKAAEAAAGATGAAFAAFLALNPSEPPGFVVEAVSGAEPPAGELFGDGRVFPPLSRALSEKRPVRLPDEATGPTPAPLAGALAAPVLSCAGDSFGVLLLGSDGAAALTERDERLAMSVAAQLGLALDRTRLEERARRERAQRSLAEAALRESDRRLRFAIGAGRIGIWEWDLKSGRAVWSPGMVFGGQQAPDQFHGTIEEALSTIHPEDRPRVESAIRATVEHGADFAVEYRVRAPSGEDRWLEARGALFRTDDGAPERVIGICAEITSQKRVEHALRASEQRFTRFMQHLPGLAWIKDADGRYLYANEAAAHAMGVAPASILGKVDDQLFPPEAARSFRTSDRRVLESGAGERSVALFDRGEGARHAMVSKFPIPVAPGEPEMIGGIAIDITDRVKSEQARALLAAIVESSDDAIISKTLDGVVTSWNAGAERIFGYAAHEIIGHPLTTIIPEGRQDEEDEILRRLRAGERVEHYETVRRMKGGRLIDVAITSSPLLDDSGRIIGASKIARDITGAKRAAAALRESENRYRHLLTSVPIAVYACDPEGRITIFNEAAERLWGRAPRLGSDTWSSVVRMLRPDGVPVTTADAPMAVTLREHRPVDATELIYERPDGARSYVLVHPRPAFDGEGRLIGATNAIVDITARKLAENALRESERHARVLLGSLPQLVWTCTPEGRCDFVSRRWLEYTGSTEREQLGSGWLRSLHPDDVVRTKEIWRAASERARTDPGASYEVEYRLRRHDGEYRWFACRASPLRDAGGGVLLWVGASADVQSIKDAEAALRVSEERFRTMADSAPVLIWIADEERRPTWFNRPWLEFTGSTLEQACVAGRDDGVHPEDRERCARVFHTAFDERRPFRMEYRLRRHDGEYRWVLDHGVPLFSPAGRLTGFIGSCIDVTDEVAARRALEHQQAALEEAVRRRTEELEVSHRRLRVSERMASIGTLSAGLGHDMANILLPIRLRLDALDRTVPSEQVRAELREIRSSIEYLQNLSSGLRMLVVEPAERTGADATELRAWWRQASTVLNSAAPSQIELVSDLPDQECWVRFTPTSLTQVVFNLVQNSIDALRPRGRGRIEVRARRRADSVVLSVTDDGPGMTPYVRERCTQPFFTTKARAMSTGLGLALVYGMVNEADGSLEIRSEPGRGTSVDVTLHAAPPPAEAKPHARLTALVRVRNPRLRAIVTAELHDLGFTTVADPAHSGAVLRVVDSGDAAETGPEVITVALSSGETDPPSITGLRQRIREAGARAIEADANAHSGATGQTGGGSPA